MVINHLLTGMILQVEPPNLSFGYPGFTKNLTKRKSRKKGVYTVIEKYMAQSLHIGLYRFSTFTYLFGTLKPSIFIS